MWLFRLFKCWKWSWRIPGKQQVAKYSETNIRYYIHFKLWLIMQPNWEKLHFLDESHFVSKKLQRKKVLGPCASPKLSMINFSDLSTTYSLTLLTDLRNDGPPFAITLRKQSNTALDFFRFVLFCLEHRHLRAGDVLVMDNAAVHWSEEIRSLLSFIMDCFQVRYIFMPTYSPELNPCELCFNTAKSWLFCHRGCLLFWLEILRSLCTI